MSNTKPEFLFHGTPRRVNGTLKTWSNTGDANGDFPDGPRDLLFATDNEDYAQVYALKTPSGHMLSAGEEKGGYIVATYINRDGWEEALSQLTPKLFVLKNEGFTNTVKRNGNPTSEWASGQAVKPITSYPVTKEMLMKEGRQLFFVQHPLIPKDVWHEWKRKAFGERPDKEGDSLFALYAALTKEGVLEHENARLGINPVDLEKHHVPGHYAQEISLLKMEMACEAVRQTVNRKGGKPPCPDPDSVANIAMPNKIGTRHSPSLRSKL